MGCVYKVEIDVLVVCKHFLSNSASFTMCLSMFVNKPNLFLWDILHEQK
jgi:hypothetical protein